MNRDSKPRRRAPSLRSAPKRARRKPAAANKKVDGALERLCLAPADAVLAHVIDEHIRRVLWAARGEISLAAQLLGLHRRSLQRMIRRRINKVAPKPKAKAKAKPKAKRKTKP